MVSSSFSELGTVFLYSFCKIVLNDAFTLNEPEKEPFASDPSSLSVYNVQ